MSSLSTLQSNTLIEHPWFWICCYLVKSFFSDLWEPPDLNKPCKFRLNFWWNCFYLQVVLSVAYNPFLPHHFPCKMRQSVGFLRQTLILASLHRGPVSFLDPLTLAKNFFQQLMIFFARSLSPWFPLTDGSFPLNFVTCAMHFFLLTALIFHWAIFICRERHVFQVSSLHLLPFWRKQVSSCNAEPESLPHTSAWDF